MKVRTERSSGSITIVSESLSESVLTNTPHAKQLDSLKKEEEEEAYI